MDFLIRYSVYIAVLLGLFVGYAVLKKTDDTYGGTKLFLLCLFFSVASVLSAMLFASGEYLLAGKKAAFGAVSTYGIYYICPVIIWGLFRKSGSLRSVFDLYAVYVPVSMMFQRIHCLLAGCCYGRTIGNTELRWPTREIEILFYAVILVALLKQKKETANNGSLFPRLALYYGCFRFINEFFRYGSGVIHMAHAWSLIAIFLSDGILTYLRKLERGRV